jgi:RES domain-containing protein
LRLDEKVRERLAELPLRLLNGAYHRQTDPKRQPFDLLPIAPHGGRWHSAGDPWPAYASSTPEAAMFELLRGFDRERSAPPPLPTRRMSELFVDDLPVVDLANELALEHVGLRREELVEGYDLGPETEHCRAIAAEVRRRPAVLGLLVPSAALPGADVLVIHPAGFRRVQVGVQQLVRLVLSPQFEPEQASSDGDD